MNTKQCSCSSVSALVPPSPCPSECPDIHFTLATSGSESSFKRPRSPDSTSSDKSYLSTGSYSSPSTLYRTVTLLLLVVCIALSAAVISLFLLISDLRNKLDDEIEGHGGVSGRLCVPCADLKFVPPWHFFKIYFRSEVIAILRFFKVNFVSKVSQKRVKI